MLERVRTRDKLPTYMGPESSRKSSRIPPPVLQSDRCCERESYSPLALFPIYSFIYKICEEPAMEQAVCQVPVILSEFPSLFCVLGYVCGGVDNSDKNN